jgi:hypothetical protein
MGEQGGAPLQQVDAVAQAALDVPCQKAGSCDRCGMLIARSDQGKPDRVTVTRGSLSYMAFLYG